MTHPHHDHHGNSTDNIRTAFFLNLGFAVLEVVGGVLTNSVAILSDALHDVGDSIAIGTAWLLNRYSERGSDAYFTYGYRRFALLGALINALILIGGSVFVLSQAFARLQAPEPVKPVGVVLLALIGITVNGYAALRLRSTESLNAHVLSWHLIEDVLGWSAILVMGIVSLFVSVPLLDPLLSIGISLIVLYNAVKNLIPVVRVFLQSVPPGADLPQLQARLGSIDGVQSVHDLRLWSLDGEHHVLTVHLVADEMLDAVQQRRIQQAASAIVHELHLDDAAIQIDLGCDACVSAPRPVNAAAAAQ